MFVEAMRGTQEDRIHELGAVMPSTTPSTTAGTAAQPRYWHPLRIAPAMRYADNHQFSFI
jgi:hypothetical protein